MTSTISCQDILDRHGMDYLREGATFGALSDDAILYLLERGELLKLDAGDRLFSLDDPANCFYIIIEGDIGFYKLVNSERKHIRDYCYGTEMGFVSMIGLNPRLGDGEAVTDSIVLSVSTCLFSYLQRDLPNDFGILLLNLSREMSRRLRDADIRLAASE